MITSLLRAAANAELIAGCRPLFTGCSTTSGCVVAETLGTTSLSSAVVALTLATATLADLGRTACSGWEIRAGYYTQGAAQTQTVLL